MSGTESGLKCLDIAKFEPQILSFCVLWRDIALGMKMETPILRILVFHYYFNVNINTI